MEDIIQFLSQLDPLWVYLAVFAIAYIENIFPPSPSDVVVVFGGSLVALGEGHFVFVLISATGGSTLGFITMYAIGRWFGRRILESGKLKFISPDAVIRAEVWFARYGYTLVVLNRFLAGTRAVVSFFAGISHLDFKLTVILSFISALIWNSLLVYAGYVLGRNWERVLEYLSTYSQVVTAAIVVLVIVLIARNYLIRRKTDTKSNG